MTVSVVRGTGLAAKDVTGIFRRTASSDPYYITNFRNKTYTSEHRSQTLEPEWALIPFALGWITDVESAPLTVQVFDYDAVGKDDFMGEIKVPTHSLFDLGPGDHAFWFVFSHSKQREYRSEEVTGKILVTFNIPVVAPLSFTSTKRNDFCSVRFRVPVTDSLIFSFCSSTGWEKWFALAHITVHLLFAVQAAILLSLGFQQVFQVRFTRHKNA